MHSRRTRLIAGLLAASALVLPGAAQAAGSREAELVARLERLETEMAQLRADLQSARAEASQSAAAAQAAAEAAATRSEQATVRVAALEAKPQAPAEGFRAGATTIKLGGYIKLIAANTRYSEGEVATNSLGRDFYLPQTIPTGKGPSSRVEDFTAKQSRFWLNFATDISGHTLKGYLETDFQTSPGAQGSQRTTNGYNLALRRAYMQFDRWTIGQDWTTFQYTGALPESTDYVGGVEGTIFVRQPQVRYSLPLDKALTLHLAAENPETASATTGSAALIENGDDSIPDFTARLAYAGKLGELSLAGLVREVRVENAGASHSGMGWGISAAGKIPLAEDKSSDLRFMATYGHNIGRYVGLNFAPDAVLDAAAGKLTDVDTLALLGALRIGLTPKLRFNLMGSYQTADYAGRLAAAGIGTYNKRAWSGAANLFYTPMKNVDLGIEYRHGERRLVNGAQGALDRMEFAAKYSF